MPEFLMLMHTDADENAAHPDWSSYLEKLQVAGVFRGGSAIGAGICLRKTDPVANPTGHLAGYIKIEAQDLAQAQELVAGNPVYEAGGTIEIRELPATG